MRRLGGVILRSCILLAFLEGALWSLSAVGLLSLPSTIPMDNYDLGVNRAMSGAGPRLYEPDRWTLNTLRPNVEITYPRLPVFRNGPETYTVHTNSAGMRDREISRDKPPGVLRIACLGDSSTFGYNVEVDEGYPRQLQALLDAQYPGRFQVLNFGVPGHASLQGVERLKHLASGFHPDVVTFAFGTNDRFFPTTRRLSDELHVSRTWRGTILFEAAKVFNMSATYRGLRAVLFHSGALVTSRAPQQPGQPTAAWVGLDEMAGAISEVKSVGDREGFSLVLLNIDLHETDSVTAVTEGAHRTGAPLINIAVLFREKKAERDREIATKHGLALTTVPGTADKFVFRVVVDGNPTEVWMRYRIFPTGAKTDIEALYDDGTHGDEHAGDGVWSLQSNLSAGQKVIYSYFAPDETGTRAREFRDTFVVNGFPMMGSPDRGLVIRPGGTYIDVYGDFYLHSDPAHPDAVGHRLIAGELRDVILELPAVQRALAKS
jgi:lysophospholipase L1-like esterase